MTEELLATHYRAYIACLNARELTRLGEFVAEDVEHNGRPFGLAGYRAMLEGDYRDIPDLHFEVQQLVANRSMVAARLAFDCHPADRFLGLAVNGRRLRFCENVMYEFADAKIVRVWSVVDKVAIEAQL